MGLWINRSKNTFDTVYLENKASLRQVILVNAEVKAGGKLTGTAQINSSGYDRISALKRYKTDGEKKYTDYLRDDDNNIKITSLKLDNMETDSLPLTQNIAFEQDLAGSDENYIYLNPNVFNSFKKNPFSARAAMRMFISVS